MNRLIKLQEFSANALLSTATLNTINIVQYRKLRMESEIDKSVIWNGGRNGRAGCGILVQMPAIDIRHPNLPGPEGFLQLTISVAEEPNVNMTPEVGTMLSAEEVCDTVLDTLHNYQVAGVGNLFAEGSAVKPNESWPDGLLGYDCTFTVRSPRNQTLRTTPPADDFTDNILTLTCVDPNAVLYYTLDGSYPGPGNPSALVYSAPVNINNVRDVHFASLAPGKLISHVQELFNTSL